MPPLEARPVVDSDRPLSSQDEMLTGVVARCPSCLDSISGSSLGQADTLIDALHLHHYPQRLGSMSMLCLEEDSEEYI